ncbi:MAG: molybdopterin-dependent oxidoreductase [Deltaproteobacteria bacterium]|nr:molybdopterin-dependent oxidoreductase [Deltaproteobacteria bacterium]
MRRPTRRFVLASGATTLALGGATAWWLLADTPDLWDEQIPFLTDSSVFYNKWDAKKRDPVFWVAAATRPDINALEWRGDGEDFTLEIGGDAARSVVTITRDDVLASAASQGSVALLKTMRCSGDGPEIRLASNAVWTGVPLTRFLKAYIAPNAKRLRVHSPDGFTANLRIADLDTADGRQTLLAFYLNGQAIPHPRGGPVRLIVPDRYGFKNVKWPRRIEITRRDEPWGNHEVDTGAGTDAGTVQLGSKILSPDLRSTNPIAVTEIRPHILRGVAFGGREAIEKVQVRIGGRDQPWRTAKLPIPKELESHHEARRAFRDRGERWPLPDVWTPWFIPWTPDAPGDYDVAVKARTATAEQPEVDMDRLDADSSWALGTIRVS